MRASVQDNMIEILQAAKEIEAALDASLGECGFSDEAERAAFIKNQASEIARMSEVILEGDSR